MNNNNPSRLLQQGFRIAVGAVTSFVETAQNPEKRAEAIADLQLEIAQKTREWAVKGEIAETEARRIIEELVRQRNRSQNSNRSYDNPAPTETQTNVNSGLQELQDELVALRIELEKMREEKNKRS